MSILSESNLNDISTPIGERYFIKLHLSTKLTQSKDVHDHESTIIVDAIRDILHKLKMSPIAIMDQLGLHGFFISCFTTLGDYNEVDYSVVEGGYKFTISQDRKQIIIQVTFISKCQS